MYKINKIKKQLDTAIMNLAVRGYLSGWEIKHYEEEKERLQKELEIAKEDAKNR